MNSNIKALFELPADKHYFCGHSLGPISTLAKQALNESITQWEQHQVCAWDQWIDLPKQCGDKIARLIGANSDDVIVCDSTTINLLKVLLAALSLNPQRRIILSENDNFPTDNYMAQSVANLKNIEFKTSPKEDILDALNPETAVLLLTHVDYKTAQKWDMKAINQKAQQHGIITVWDLSHSVGVLTLECAKSDADFAVGCTYKYLNGGPGAPSFIYVNQKHQKINPTLQGWMGHQSPFDFSAKFHPALGIKRYLSGTPSILSMKTLLGALAIFDNLDISQIESATHALGDNLIKLCQEFAPDLECISPPHASLRGAHVAFRHPQAQALANALIERGVIVDYRAPDIIRFGISALFLSKNDIVQATLCLQKVLKSAHAQEPGCRGQAAARRVRG